MSLLVGDAVRVSGTFKVNGNPTDPTTTSLSVKTPGGVTTVYDYGSSAIVRLSTGRFQFDLDLAEAGTYRVMWSGTGDAAAVEVKTIQVGATGF